MDLIKRLEKITCEQTLQEQMRLAKNYAMRLKREKQQDMRLAEKLEIDKKHKAACATLHQLRRIVFDIEDALAENKPALSVLDR